MARNRRAPPKPMNPLKRKPVRRVMLLNLARMRKWDYVYALIDNGEAGIDDFLHAVYATPLYEAVRQHDTIAVDKLMQRGATVSRYVFTTVVHTGNIRMAERFVQNGFDVTTLIEDGETPTETALRCSSGFFKNTDRGCIWLEKQLKKARARRNWAAVRSFVHVRSHALFWYAYMGKQLCGHGGKWATRDRAAFEDEFSPQCE